MTSATGHEALLRACTPRVLGALIRRYGDFAAAEDAVQEAMLAAALQWPQQGVPDNPGAWLYQVASRRLIDRIRSEGARRRRETVATEPVDDPLAEDDTLVLLFMCCHPALTAPSAIALTLRAVGGLSTAEIAGAFLVPEATMAQRISRAKQSIQASGVPFLLPAPAERAERLAAVLHVLYLVFNEGYATTTGAELQRVGLAAEAIRLTRALHRLQPDDPEITGLLALLLLTDARRHARTGPGGELVPLDAQDRSLWDRDAIAEGVALVTAALSQGAIGVYPLQAAIAALHDEAPSTEATDWPQILALYDVLATISDNPMAALSRAIAASMVHGTEVGLALLDTLEADGRLAGHHRLDAVRAHLFERTGDVAAAIRHYRAAAGRTASLPERTYLVTRASRLANEAGLAPAPPPRSGPTGHRSPAAWFVPVDPNTCPERNPKRTWGTDGNDAATGSSGSERAVRRCS